MKENMSNGAWCAACRCRIARLDHQEYQKSYQMTVKKGSL